MGLFLPGKQMFKNHVPLLSHQMVFFSFLESSPEDMFTDFAERERERVGEREKHQCQRETSLGCLSYLPQPGIEPETFGLWTMLQPTEPPSQGQRSLTEMGEEVLLHLGLSFPDKLLFHWTEGRFVFVLVRSVPFEKTALEVNCLLGFSILLLFIF